MFIEHFVRMGDSLEKLADFYGTTIDEIKDVNNLTSNEIYIGQILKIPYETPFRNYTVVEGDDLYKIARANNILEEDLAFINGLTIGDYLYPGQTILLPKEGYIVYVTKEGDSLEGLEEKLNLSRIDLIRTNRNIYLLPEQLLVYDK